MPKAFVTGATGFVGSNVARVLLESGREIRLLARPGSDRRNLPNAPAVEICEGDLTDRASLERGLRGCDEVFHVAADYRFWARDSREFYENNVDGTRNLLRAAGAAGVKKFVHTSTVGTIGLADEPNPAHESSPYDPGQFSVHYKKSKWEAEKIALEFAKDGLPVVIVNPSTPIGPWDRKPTPTGKLIVDFVNGKMPAYVETGLNFVHVRDVALGHLLAAEKGKVGERYILGNQNLTMLNFLELLGRLTGRQVPKIRIPYRIAWFTGLVSTGYSSLVSKKHPAVPIEAVKMSKRFMFFDASKAVRELGLPQTSLEIAALDALGWFDQNGYFTSRLEVKREILKG